MLADVIASGARPVVVRLTEMFRQAAQSKIITTAHAINAVRMPNLAPPKGETDFYSVPAINPELQVALNPAGVKKKVERFGWTFAPGDKIMQIENDYDKDVYNGDIGMVEDVDLDEGEVVVDFDGRSVTSVFGELDTLVPAYAATIHKSQGLE